MRSTIICVLLALCSLSLLAVDKWITPNIKTGLWEMTETHNMTGMPPMPSIPPDALAKMTPEQRAQFEAHMKSSMGGQPKATTRKYCMTKEKLERNMAFGDTRPECTRTVLSSSTTMAEVKVHCQEKEMTTDGTFKFEAASSESVKGTMRMVMTGHDRTMNMDMNFTSKYLGPACGDVK
jgi:hypothetical protein